MQLLNESLILSPSDLGESLHCDHLVGLELRAASGIEAKPKRTDSALEVLTRRGIEHERNYLEALKARGFTVAEVTADGKDADALHRAEAETLEAMCSGADVIFQATFFNGRWRGHADFLERVQEPSSLGTFSYEVIDTKLARHAKVEAVLQTSNYSEHVARLQGVAPERMHLVLGDNARMTFLVKDFDAYYRSIKRRFERMIDDGVDLDGIYPDPVAHCAVCAWVDQCVERRVNDDHLCLVAGMRSNQIEQLNDHGISTVAALGAMETFSTPGIGTRTLEKLHNQARLQLEQRKDDKVRYELLPLESDGTGFGALPEPSSGDLFFDMEGDPYVGVHGIEYLFGVTEVASGQPVYKSWWGHDLTGEKRAFEQFVDFVMHRLEAEPGIHIYHYAPYEVTAMKKLAGHHGTRETEIDSLLRGKVFVDLYSVVRQSVRISQGSYSIKMLEPLYMEKRETKVSGGSESIVAYENWLELGDQGILDDIEAYNRDDCESTLKLRNWLEARRNEAIERFGPISRPEPQDTKGSEQRTELDGQVDLLCAALCASPPGVEAPANDQACWLLANLLEWHRRESKSEWWRYFKLLEMSDDELFEDREALSGLHCEGVVDEIKRSLIHRYHFDPLQDHKIVPSSSPVDPRTETAAGTVVAIDANRGIIDLKRGKSSKVEHPSSLIPPGPIPQPQQQGALIELGQWVVDHGVDSTGQFIAARDLLLRRSPRLRSGANLSADGPSAESSVERACRLVLDLDNSCLAIQGPPGSGKTYTGAEIVLALVNAGKRVAITANSHKTVGNLLDAVIEHDSESSVSPRILQKADESDRCSSRLVQCTQSNDDVATAIRDDAVDVVGGTAWLFSRTELREAFDVLIVDEAGQMSLADVLAIGTSARSIVLLGDPQQLAQPSKGIHPDGAEKSALAHLLGNHQTIPVDLGLLLDKTWRLHPEVCAFTSDTFYDGRLTSVPSCTQQQISGDDTWSGVGLRYLKTPHRNNRTSSPEEVAIIRKGIDEVVGRNWTNQRGEVKAVTLEDVLVVAPYNAQVTLLKRALPEGARVGTVDKFQGLEAAAVFYSLAASTPNDISRGMEFLYSVNRLNVAVSRARCLAFLVCSPALLTITCRTPEQARLANALCRFVEMAGMSEQAS